MDQTMDMIYRKLEPLVIHVRPGNDQALQLEIVDHLVKEHGFIEIQINECIKGEVKRGTALGLRFE